ncbi:MAG: iron ABC transporter permease [Candidatus Fermentibacteraceae bacterium]
MRGLWWVLLLILAAGIALSLLLGPMEGAPGWVVLRLRLPRTALALMAGASLAVSGCVLQAVLRNGLATPYTLGISAGAGVTAGALLLSGAVVSRMVLVLSGTAGALATVAAVYALARAAAGGGTGSRIVLAGVTLNLIGASVLLLFEYLSPASRLVEIIRWMMGDLSAVDSQLPLYLLPFTVAGLAAAGARAGVLNQLESGPGLAASRGVSIVRERTLLLAAAALLAGGTVGAVGPIGFVGLIVPHMMRRLAGGDYRRLVYASALGGAALLLLADVAARLVISPAELPIGVVMSILGGPFFLYLLLRGGRRTG